jgi:HK97 gp10 family phage protein
MAVQIVKMEGFRELERALAELPKATARNVLRRTLKKAAQPIEDDMEANAPVDTGWASKSIASSFTLNPAQKREAKKETKSFAEIHIGTRRGSAALLQEFGTFKQPARPFMRPAWEANQQISVKIIFDELGGEIDKAAARLARKAARTAAKG